jgi:hypothetical protein
MQVDAVGEGGVTEAGDVSVVRGVRAVATTFADAAFWPPSQLRIAIDASAPYRVPLALRGVGQPATAALRVRGLLAEHGSAAVASQHAARAPLPADMLAPGPPAAAGVVLPFVLQPVSAARTTVTGPSLA